MDNKKCVLLVPLQRLSKAQKTYTKGILRVYKKQALPALV